MKNTIYQSQKKCIGPSSGFDFSYNAPFSHSGTTLGKCDDCSLRTGKDVTYKVVVPCDGNYTFSLCGSSFDTYLYLTTAPCGGTTLASNDDFCSLQSQISSFLVAGTYYITIEGFSSTSSGAYSLNVTRQNITGTPVISGATNLCGGSSSAYSVNGVTGATGYNWSVSGGTVISGQGTSSVNIQWNNINGNVTVTPFNACENGTNGSLAVNVTPAPVINVTSTNVSCNGLNNGQIIINPSSANYAYSINGSTFTSSNTFSNLSRGTYSGVMATIPSIPGCSSAAQTVIITQPAVLTGSTSTSNFNGYGVSCSGGNNGSANVSVSGGVTAYSYNWSNGATTANNSGLVAGNYNVTVTDANGCTVSASATLTQPTALALTMPSNQVVYFGYTPASCATLNSSVSGGVTAYSYNWTSGSTSSSAVVCPSLTTTYTLTVTDANGCTISGDVKVCVVNVVCYAGNSNVAKVEICHLPPGNNQNPQTLCVAASSVPSHLAHGDYLGSCGTVASCNSTSSRSLISHDEVEMKHDGINYLVYPNPANDNLNIEFTFVENGSGKIEITDITGRTLLSTPVYNGIEGDTVSNSININEYKAGVYFIKLELNGQLYTQKVIKQ